MITLLRREHFIYPADTGLKVLDLEDVEDDKANLVRRLLRLSASQLDAHVEFDPVNSLMDTLNLEHRDLLHKYEPTRFSDLLTLELAQCYRIFAEKLALTPPEDTSITELTIDMSTFTYSKELLAILQ